MKKHVALSITILSAALAFSIGAPCAEEKVTIDCGFGSGYEAGLPTHFEDVQKQAMQVSKAICEQQIDGRLGREATAGQSVKDLALAAENLINKRFPKETFPGVAELAHAWVLQVTAPDPDYRNFSFISYSNVTDAVAVPPRNKLKLSLMADSGHDVTLDLDSKQRESCESIVAGTTCYAAFEDIANAVQPFQYHITDWVLKGNGRKIATLQDEWTKFINKSRYQTPLDVWVTTFAYSSRYKEQKLVGPPGVQLFLLRPTLVYEHIDEDAIKGDRDNVTLAIEWAGINWWKAGIGFSVTTTYRDTDKVDTTGIGATLHIRNKYSIGWTHRRHSTNAVFVNLDFLEWLGDKQKKYEKYRGYF